MLDALAGSEAPRCISQLAGSCRRGSVSELGMGRGLQREMPEVRSFQLFQVMAPKCSLRAELLHVFLLACWGCWQLEVCPLLLCPLPGLCCSARGVAGAADGHQWPDGSYPKVQTLQECQRHSTAWLSGDTWWVPCCDLGITPHTVSVSVC